MSLRVRCTRCRPAFLTAEDQPGQTVECLKCGARHRLPGPRAQDAATIEPDRRAEVGEPAVTVFVLSPESTGARPDACGYWQSRAWRWRFMPVSPA